MVNPPTRISISQEVLKINKLDKCEVYFKIYITILVVLSPLKETCANFLFIIILLGF